MFIIFHGATCMTARHTKCVNNVPIKTRGLPTGLFLLRYYFFKEGRCVIVEEENYVKCISLHFMCSKELARILIKSAEINNSKKEMDRIAQEKWKELYENANQHQPSIK